MKGGDNMAILNRDEFFSRIHEQVGTDTSDTSISFVEDMTDTYNSLESRANGDGEDWEKKYHDLDESWKKKYRHRFFNGGDRSVPDDREETETRKEDITIDELFK